MAELVFFSCSPDLSGEPCLFLSMQPLGAAIFLVHLLESLSCFLITYFLFFGFGLNICVRHTVLLGCFRSDIIKRSDCGLFGRIMIKPTDCSLSISTSILFCLSVFLHLILLIVCLHSEVFALPSYWQEAHL